MKTNHPAIFQSLGFQTAIKAQVSDHQLCMSGGVLFFNMMMRGRYNENKSRFNNGFGLFENKLTYHRRLGMIARVLAEISANNPHLYAIGLAEAPVKAQDIQIFISACREYPSLDRFRDTLTLDAFTSWGVASFFDSNQFEINRLEVARETDIAALSNRFQITEIIEKSTKQRLRICTVHLPYDLAKSENKGPLIEFIKGLFDPVIPTIVMGDFNINPSSLKQYFPHYSFEGLEQSNLLVETDKHSRAIIGHRYDCVDAIIRNGSKLRNLPMNQRSPHHFFNQFLANQRLVKSLRNQLFKALGQSESETENKYP